MEEPLFTPAADVPLQTGDGSEWLNKLSQALERDARLFPAPMQI